MIGQNENDNNGNRNDRHGRNDGRRRGRTNRESGDNDEVEEENQPVQVQPPNSQQSQQVIGLEQLTQAVKSAVASEILPIRNELNITQEAVLDVNKKVDEITESKKEGEKPVSTTPAQPAQSLTTTPVEAPKQTPIPIPQKQPGFFDQIGESFRNLGRIGGIVVMAVLSPLAAVGLGINAGVAALDKFFYGMAQQLGLKPKNTPPKPA